MKQPALSQLMPKLFFSALSAVAWIAIANQPLMAQSTGAADLFNDSSDVGNGGFGDGGDLDMFELMHRAQQGTIRNRSDFLRDQQEQIGSEAANFRTRQQRVLQQQQPGTVPLGATEPGTVQPTTTQPASTTVQPTTTP